MELKWQLGGRSAAIWRRRLSVKVAKRRKPRKEGREGTFQNHDFDDKVKEEDRQTDGRTRVGGLLDSAAVGNHL